MKPKYSTRTQLLKEVETLQERLSEADRSVEAALNVIVRLLNRDEDERKALAVRVAALEAIVTPAPSRGGEGEAK